MAESEFSWLKIASFIGACALIVLAFVSISSGINMITANNVFFGATSVIGGIVCIAGAVIVYKYYQNKSLKDRYGK